MTVLRWHDTLGFAVMAAVLSGCAASGSAPAYSGTPSRIGPGGARATLHAGIRRSWMSPDAHKQRLLYASDADSATVDVYKKYGSSSPKLVGQLTGFEYPYGECADSVGNVYISDLYGGKVVEYAHAGTSPLRSISVTGFPIGCAVDRKTGNLAVSIYLEAHQSGQGGVLVFPAASGTPTLSTDPDMWQYWPPAYDSKGNLFFQGYNPLVKLDELPARHSTLRTISLGSTSIVAPGSVMWDGAYVAATDQQYQGGSTTAIYRISVSGSNGTVVGTVVLTDSCDGANSDVPTPFIQGSTVFGPNH
jgi:hypothetical protein